MSLAIRPTERSLAERAIEGDRLALEELILLHEGRVTALCRGRLRHPADVDDAVQETFARVLDHIDQLRDPEAFGPWVRTIAARVCIDHFRDQSRRHASELDDQTIDEGLRPDEVLEVAEERRRVHAALDHLGERDRHALWLRHGVEAPISMIADELGVTEGSARVLLTRARNKFREATAGMAAVIPLPWRRWTRRHLDHLVHGTDAAIAFGQMAAVAGLVLLPMAPQPVPTSPTDDPAPQVVVESHLASLEGYELVIGDGWTPATAPVHSHRTQDVVPAESPEPADRPGPIRRITDNVEVTDEYPEDQEYLIEVQLFAAEEGGNTLRVYGNPLDDAGATVDDTVGGLLGE